MKKIPEFKSEFIDRYSKLTDFKKFKEYSLKDKRKSVRVNSLKISVEDFKKKQAAHNAAAPAPGVTPAVTPASAPAPMPAPMPHAPMPPQPAAPMPPLPGNA